MQKNMALDENIFRMEISPFLTNEYEVRHVGKFENIKKMIEYLPNLIEEFAHEGYIKIEKRNSHENVMGTDYHWNFLPKENFSNSVELILSKIKPSLVGGDVVRGGACDSKRVSIYDTGTISINTELWHEKSN
jgi:hypothetical protein